MPQITNLRLLLSSANHHHGSPFSGTPALFPKYLSFSSSFPFFFKPHFEKHKPPVLFSAFSSFSNKPQAVNKDIKNSRSFKRNKSTLRDPVEKKSSNSDKGGFLGMEVRDVDNTKSGNDTFGFNRKRAEGRDDSDRPRKNLQLKARKLNPANTISYVQILGTGMDTQDTSPSVLLFFDKQRFIFNAGEGLQRFCSEHKIKLSKIDHIFLSRVCSETAGGIPGLLLTLAGMGDEGMSVNVWGPSDLKYLVDAMKSFIPNAAMVHTRCFGPTPGSNESDSLTSRRFGDPFVLIDDEVVKISAILLGPNVEVSEKMGAKSSDIDHPKSGARETKPGDLSVVYICELPEIKGKFDPKKAAALGLRAGPKYRELQLGNPVKSDSQDIMVHPSDVMGPSVPGPIVLLVDCPTLSHVQELSSLECLTPYYTHSANDLPEGSKYVHCVIHLSPASVTKSNDYQTWMSKFSGAQHIMAGHDMKNIEVPILKSSARIGARLNYLCRQFFPSPGIGSLQQLNCLASGEGAYNKKILPSASDLIPAENLLKFILRPYANLGIDKYGIPNLSTRSEIIEELQSEIPEIVDASQRVAQFWLDNREACPRNSSMAACKTSTEEPWFHDSAIPSCLEDITREDMEIVFLGTGSSQPSKYRNVSSIFINLFSKGSLLLDCGEGTLGQLKRRFGVHGADEAVRGLRCIWISHIHADHHTGLARILALRRDLLKGMPHEPVIVVGPRQLKKFLDAYQRLEDLDMQFLDCWHTTEASLEVLQSDENEANQRSSTTSQDPENGNKGGSVDSSLFARGSRMQSCWKRPESLMQNTAAIPIAKSLKKVLSEAGLEALISFPVVHCPQAFGVVLKAANRPNSTGKMIPGWKIVYSGDTRPCPELIRASNGATVLIHEATFEDSLMDEAIARNHSTTKEAVEVGDSAGAYRIILTHFSQRYPKIPVFDETHMHKTSIAFDMMSVNLADVHILPRVLPYLKLLFRNEIIVDESEDVDMVTAVA